MLIDQYRATWKGPGRDTEEEALEDIKLLNTILEKYAPALYAYATSTYKKDRPVPGGAACNEKMKSTIEGSCTWCDKCAPFYRKIVPEEEGMIHMIMEVEIVAPVKYISVKLDIDLAD